MKKALSLILALVMCLSLCACGNGSNTTDTLTETQTLELKDCVIGTWERNFTSSEGNAIRQVIEVYQGGTGKFSYYVVGNGTEKDGSFPATWEIKDGVMNFKYGFAPLGYLLDSSAQPMTLTQVDDANVIFVKIP